MSQPPPTPPSRPADQAPEPGPGHDPVFAAVDGLVRDGTLDHTQADRVYAAMRATGTSATAPSTRGSFPTRLAASVALVGAGTASGAALLAASLANLFEEGFDWQAFVVVGGVAGALLALPRQASWSCTTGLAGGGSPPVPQDLPRWPSGLSPP